MKLELPTGDYAAYIFDCDGTLADTMPLHYRAWLQAFKEYGTPFIFDEEEFYHLGGTSTVKIVELFNQRHGTTYDPHKLSEFKENIFVKLIEQVEPIHVVVDLARQFFQAGKPMAVASGGGREIVQQTLHFLQIGDLFRVVVTPEDVKHGKPAPDLFLLAAQKLGVAPKDCLVFEDTPTGVAAANAAEMDYVLVPSRGLVRT